MAPEATPKGGQILAAVLRFLKIFIVNTWRRLLMLCHYSLICFHQLRLRRAWRILGKRVYYSLEKGEVNPMLAGDVKDSLQKVQAIEGAKEKRYQAIAALREKIRAARAPEAPPPPEPEPAPAQEPKPAPVQEPEPAPAPEAELTPVEEAEPAPTEEVEPTPAEEAKPSAPKEPGPEQPQS